MIDQELQNIADEITNETRIGANTAQKIGALFNSLIEKILPVDDISQQPGTSTTKVMSQAAIRTFVYAIRDAILKGSGFNLDSLQFNPATETLLTNIGQLRWNAGNQTLEIKCSNDVTLSIGQENYIRGKNAETTQILNGKVVYVSGGQGANSLIKRASNNNTTGERVIGVATQNIDPNNIGFITTNGIVNEINTSAFAEGDVLWLGVDGALTNVKPGTDVNQICIGVVLRSHATQGSLLVSVKDDWRGQVAQLRSDLNEKIEKNAIKQILGSSETDVMSQKAVTDEINQIDEKLIIDDTASDLSFADSNHNEIVQFKNGGIRTKNFDSENVAAYIPSNSIGSDKLNFEPIASGSDDSQRDLSIADEFGNRLVEFENGNIRTKNFDSEKTISASKETGADVDICDENDNIVLRVSKGHIKTKYFDSTVVNSEPSSVREIVEDTFRGSRFKYDEVRVLDYYAAYDELCNYRHIVEKEAPIGYSTLPSGDRLSKDANQYPINLYRIPNANAAKRIVLMGAIHGDSQYTETNPTGNGWYGDSGDAQEAILIPYFFVVDLIRHRDNNPQYKKLLEMYEIDIIPIINPWGVQNHSRRNGNNVDLNRNFDVTDSNGESRWENVVGSSASGKGASAFSENESQAIRDYINSYNDIHLVIETHARGNVNLEGDYRFFAVCPDDDSARELESAISDAVSSAKAYFGTGGGYKGYTRDNTNPSCYSWIFYENGIPAFEPELAQNMANRFYSIITLSEERRLNLNDVYTDSAPQTNGYAHTLRVVSSDGSDEVLVETETYYTFNNGVFTCGSDSITISSHSVLDSKARHSKELQYSQVWYYKRLLFNTL